MFFKERGVVLVKELPFLLCRRTRPSAGKIRKTGNDNEAIVILPEVEIQTGISLFFYICYVSPTLLHAEIGCVAQGSSMRRDKRK